MVAATVVSAVALVSSGCNCGHGRHGGTGEGGGIVSVGAVPTLCDFHAVATELVLVLCLAVVVIILVTVILVAVILIILVITSHAVGHAGRAGLIPSPIVVSFVPFSCLDLAGFGASGGHHVSMAEVGGSGNGGEGGGGGGGLGTLGGGNAYATLLKNSYTPN